MVLVDLADVFLATEATMVGVRIIGALRDAD